MLLHQFETCPFCIKVRNKLDDLGLDYETREAPRKRSNRTTVKELSGQYKVPVLEDEDEVVHDSKEIIDYLEENYG